VVNTTNAANCSGYYLDENNQKITVTSQGTGWQVSFINKAFKPSALEISATTYGINPTDSFTLKLKFIQMVILLVFILLKVMVASPKIALLNTP
jgi:hypothetical protein